MKPIPWSQAKDSELEKLRGVCLDIDETLSTKGKLTAGAFAALWELKKKGYLVVPVTGRPAGWCDHIARFWPVDAVIGENGAFVFYLQNGVRRRLDTPGLEIDSRQKLAALGKKILEHFPHAKWASDQNYRECDLAIDICEDVKPWSSAQVDQLLDLCQGEGAHAKLSSIHVNAWFGDYDKLKGLKNWLSVGGSGAVDDLLFIGDSPNDEPLFSAFHKSVGVANLSRYLDRMKSTPRWITLGESGAGFVEMAARLKKLI